MMAKLERSPQQARMEAVSRDALVQAALQEIAPGIVRPALLCSGAYGVSLAYVSDACALRLGAPTRNCCKSTAWRPPRGCCAAAI